MRKVLPECQPRSPQLLGMMAVRGLEEEIENEHAVVVGGDGVEAHASEDKEARKNEFGLSSKHGEKELDKSRKASEASSGLDEDSDFIPSWVKSPYSTVTSREKAPRAAH